MSRREAFKAAGAALVAPALVDAQAPGHAHTLQDSRAPLAAQAGKELLAAGEANRKVWYGYAQKLAEPVLRNLAAGTLRARMPVEQAGNVDRRGVTHLEAFGRLLAGMAPWIESGAAARYGPLALQALDRAVDPKSPAVM